MLFLLPVGKGMHYMPGTASLAATHRLKVKKIRRSTLRDTTATSDPRSAILNFEKCSLAYDNSMKDKTEGNTFIGYK